MKTTVHAVTYCSVKSALILPAALLCLASCKKEEVVSLKKETSGPTQTASASSSAPQKQEPQGFIDDTPLGKYIFAIKFHDLDRSEVSDHEAFLACKPSELKDFAVSGSTFDSIREHIAKYREDEKKSAAKLEEAKKNFLLTHPDPAIVARIEAHLKELKERGDAYQELNLKLHSDHSTYLKHYEELEKLKKVYVATQFKKPSEIIAAPVTP